MPTFFRYSCSWTSLSSSKMTLFAFFVSVDDVMGKLDEYSSQ